MNPQTNGAVDGYERFYVDCPGCSEPKGSYSTLMTAASHRCSCGTSFTIDIENQTVGEILEK